MNNDINRVDWFAAHMKEALKDNRHKPGWDYVSFLWLFAKLGEEVGEMGELLNEIHYNDGHLLGGDREKLDRAMRVLTRECADVANLAFMIADNAQAILQEGHDTD